MESKKMKVDKLSLEVTRKCNLKCKHCFRGDAQSVDMTSKIIDAVFSQISEVNELIFTGGEPLLALDQICYAIYSAKKHGVKVNSWQMITNGIITDYTKLGMFFKYIDKFFSDSKGMIAVSRDDYHEKEIESLGFDLRQNIKRLKSKCFENGVEFNINKIKKTFSVGRAKNLPESVSTTYLLLENDFIKSYDGLNNVLNTCLEISAKGDVIRPNRTYEEADKTAYGNVLKSKLQDIIYDIIDMQTVDELASRFSDSSKNEQVTFNK